MAKAARKLTPEEEVALDDKTEPTEPIEIELPDEPDGSTEVELAPEPKPEPKPEPRTDENALQAQVDAQKRAEELQRANAELQRQMAEREAALQTERNRGDDAEYNSVLTAIAAERATLDKAEQDYAALLSQGNYSGAARAQRAMTETAARLDRLEDGKAAFEQRRTAPAVEKHTSAPAQLDFEQRIAQMPDAAKGWLRQHPEFINDTAKNQEIQSAHAYLVQRKKIEPFSSKYFEALDEEFGFKAAGGAIAPEPQRRSMPVSAPVSRDAPSVTGKPVTSSKMHLSEEERRIARTSFTAPNMTNAQKEFLYAQNKRKLAQRRAAGTYPMPERN